MTLEKYIRNCPECGKEIFHKTKHILNQSIKENRLCKSCKQIGCRNGLYGKHMSLETKEKLRNSCVIGQFKRFLNKNERNKLSDGQKKRYSNIEERKKTSKSVKKSMNRPDIRKKHLDSLYQSQWIKVKTDKGQLELLEKWNRLGFNFEPNYQVKTDMDLFYIDGYDKERNIVLEYDTKYHRKKIQKEKDLIRQSKIVNILNPKAFWRYDSVTNTMTDILQG